MRQEPRNVKIRLVISFVLVVDVLIVAKQKKNLKKFEFLSVNDEK